MALRAAATKSIYREEEPEAPPTSLLDDASLEMTAKHHGALVEAATMVAPGTRVNIAYVASEAMAERVATAGAASELGLVPVPHISARRLRGEAELEELLRSLAAVGAAERLVIVGGDPPRPLGPYMDALSVIASGLPLRQGVRSVDLAGYPEGHPTIPTPQLWRALEDKLALLAEQGIEAGIVTQFSFDADAVLDWLGEVRARGITAPVRIGVPGPAGVRQLLRYASLCGVGTGTRIARKYGLSLTNLVSTTGPDRFLERLAAGHHPGNHGEARLHFYTFGGVGATATWIDSYRRRNDV